MPWSCQQPESRTRWGGLTTVQQRGQNHQRRASASSRKRINRAIARMVPSDWKRNRESMWVPPAENTVFLSHTYKWDTFPILDYYKEAETAYSPLGVVRSFVLVLPKKYVFLKHHCSQHNVSLQFQAFSFLCDYLWLSTANWLSCKCPWSLQGSRTRWLLRIPSNSDNSMILWLYSSLLHKLESNARILI